MEPFPKIIKALRGERVVVPLPGKASFEVATGGQRLAGLDYLEECEWLVKFKNVKEGFQSLIAFSDFSTENSINVPG